MENEYLCKDILSPSTSTIDDVSCTKLIFWLAFEIFISYPCLENIFPHTNYIKAKQVQFSLNKVTSPNLGFNAV